MEPNFRAFVGVELPFRLVPPRTVHVAADASESPATARSNPGVSPREAQAVAAFLPPSASFKILQVAGDRRAGAVASTLAEDTNEHEEDNSDEENGFGEAPPARRKRARPGVSAKRSDGEIAGEQEGSPPGDKATAVTTARAVNEPRMEDLYQVTPVSRRRVSTQWESHSRDSEAVDAQSRLWSYVGDPEDAQGKAAWEADRRREVFPSVEPQLLQETFLRNDLLLRVTRRKRVRRWRDAVTGDVMREEALPWPADDATASATVAESDGAPLGPRVEARVTGVVSREALLRRPADFAFASVTAEEARRAPAVHHADSFAPGHFLSYRMPFTVGYTPGRDANTSVLAHQAHLAQLGHTDPVQRALLAETGFRLHTAHDGDGERNDAIAGDGGADVLDRTLRTLYADATDLANFPPLQTEEQREQLRLLGSSADGSRPDTDPPEVCTLVQLLAARPMWTMADLCDTMLRSGQCPVDHSNRRVIHALTYVVVQGPFNRVRIRLGYDPFCNAAVNVRYQMVAVRIMRRSELGVLLRDVSRSPHVGRALQVIRHRHKDAETAYLRAHAGEFRATTLARLSLIIEKGYLSQFMQIIDVLDDAEIARVVEATPARETMPVSQRLERHGWLQSDAQYVRLITHIMGRLDRLLRDEVLPLLQLYEGTTGNQGPAAGSATSVGASAAKTARGEEEEPSEQGSEVDDDDHASGAASAGSDGENDEDDSERGSLSASGEDDKDQDEEDVSPASGGDDALSD